MNLQTSYWWTTKTSSFCVCFLASAWLEIILVELYLVAELVRRYQEQKEETMRQRIQVAVLQMRPHFIHNTLMSIYYLCAQDPQKAQQVILDFSRYLQSNFTAIAQEGTIPFSEELEHTRAYLAVEQARYQGHLFVEFDTPNTFFRIPALTLQPIVENAVKHGLDPDLEPLYVTVTTEDTDNDDGSRETHYTYYVQYQTEDGQTVEAKLGKAPLRTAVGDRLRIKYLPEKPKYVIPV